MKLPELTYEELKAINALPPCPDCAAQVGGLHMSGCDVEQCPICGGQLLSCGHRPRTRLIPWSGQWPGDLECQEFGWYSYMSMAGWVRCSADYPDATEDLNRLHIDAVWNRKNQRFEKR